MHSTTDKRNKTSPLESTVSRVGLNNELCQNNQVYSFNIYFDPVICCPVGVKFVFYSQCDLLCFEIFWAVSKKFQLVYNDNEKS